MTIVPLRCCQCETLVRNASGSMVYAPYRSVTMPRLCASCHESLTVLRALERATGFRGDD